MKQMGGYLGHTLCQANRGRTVATVAAAQRLLSGSSRRGRNGTPCRAFCHPLRSPQVTAWHVLQPALSPRPLSSGVRSPRTAPVAAAGTTPLNSRGAAAGAAVSGGDGEPALLPVVPLELLARQESSATWGTSLTTLSSHLGSEEPSG